MDLCLWEVGRGNLRSFRRAWNKPLLLPPRGGRAGAWNKEPRRRAYNPSEGVRTYPLGKVGEREKEGLMGVEVVEVEGSVLGRGAGPTTSSTSSSIDDVIVVQ